MSSSNSVLKGKKIGVIGFNARPLACSIHRMGGLPFVSDYWGDSDLDACSEEWIAVLSPVTGSRQRGSLAAPVHLSLSENFEHSFSDSKLDYIFIGSGFDDHTDTLDSFEKKHGITGNSLELMRGARDKNKLAILAETNNIRYPNHWLIENHDEATEIAEKNGFPFVIRPVTSGGGAGIRKFSGFRELEVFYKALEKSDRVGPRILQEYVSGIDLSASVLGTGDNAFTLSVQDQLIGLPSAGRLSDFVYCGNRIPASVNEKVRERIQNVSETLTTGLGLIGSIGIDFVVSHTGEIWLLEVNPRFQGTLEMLEQASNISVSELHVMACEGSLPDKMPVYRPTTKMIVYAHRDGVVPDLSAYPNTVDRSPSGVEVHKGDPVCSIVESGDDGTEVFSRVQSIAARIQRDL